MIEPREILKLRLAKEEIDIVGYRRLCMEVEGIQVIKDNKIKIIKTRK